MPTIKTGRLRSLTMNVTRTGEDGSTSPLTLNGKIDLGGGFGAITDEQLAALTDEQFDARVEQWKVYVQTTYAQSEPNLYEEIYPGFSRLKGLVVRAYNLWTDDGKMFATIYPTTLEAQTLNISLKDSVNNTVSTTITGGNWYPENKPAAVGISDLWSNMTVSVTGSYNGADIYYEAYIQGELDYEYNRPPNLIVRKHPTEPNVAGFIKAQIQIIDYSGFAGTEQVGICWGASENPGLSGSHTTGDITDNGDGWQNIGNSSPISSGSYYVRGYYIKDSQVTYSDQITYLVS